MLFPLLIILGVLGVLAVAEAFLVRFAKPLRMLGACACLVGVASVLFHLLLRYPVETIALPFGAPGLTLTASLDGLSAYFLLLVFIVAAASLFAARDYVIASGPLLYAFVAGMVITLIAGDGFGMFFGFETMAAASWLLILAGDDTHTQQAGRVTMTMAMIGALALLAAQAAGFGLAGSFADWRAAPPTGERAVMLLVLALIGVGSKAGLPPFNAWLPMAHTAAPAPVSAIMSGAMTKVALYVLIRLLFDLAGPNQPLWWGVPLLLLGAIAAVYGALRANFETDIKFVLAASTIENVGVIAAAIGLAMIAQSANMQVLGAVALGAALLHALSHGVVKCLMFLSAGYVDHEAGGRRLDRLGGLIHFMPTTALCAILGAGSLAALPPTAGFASLWLLFQSLLTAPRLGSFLLQIMLPLAALLLAIGGALALASMIRLIGVAFLGRPRAVRTAGAHETSWPSQLLLVGLAALAALIGIFPALPLYLAGSALHTLTGVNLDASTSLFGIGALANGSFYAALPIALILAAIIVAVRLLSAIKPPSERRARIWDNGYRAPPVFQPFGDTVTQYGAASLSEPLGRTLAVPLLNWQITTAESHFSISWHDPFLRFIHPPILRARDWLADRAEPIQRLTIRRTLGLMMAALVILLAVVAWLEQS